MKDNIKKLDKGFGIKKEDSKTMAKTFMIDVNKRKKNTEEPRFTV